jgi:Tfp pilus assembly protein PilN
MTEQNRVDQLLTKLLEGDTSEWKSLNRLEQYIVCILTHTGIEELGEPMNRLEALLQALYQVVPANVVEILSARLEEK